MSSTSSALATPGRALSVGALVLAAWSGFISLSYEILWMRVFSFMTMGSALAFPMSLGLFLLGVALGSRWSKRYSQKHSQKHSQGGVAQLGVVALYMIASSLFGWATIPLMSLATLTLSPLQDMASLYLICMGAALFGVQLPLIAHFGIEADSRAGVRLSYVYVANIVGSVSGSLFTGFFLLDRFALSTLVTGLGVVGVVAGLSLLTLSRSQPNARVAGAWAAGLVVCVGLVAARPLAFDSLYINLLNGVHDTGITSLKHVIETKSGVVVVDQNDVVYGGGTYDGKFSTSFVHDTNFVIRPYALAAFHKAPKKVLFIGLGSGSWAKVVSGHPQVEQITIVEISPNYVQLAEYYPGFQSLIQDPRVRVITDDGRRWLLGTDERFDAIISNTTFHWRSMASNLLSVEFFELIKAHLEPDGIFMYNTTGSISTVASSLEVFEDTYMVFNAVVASQQPIPYDPEHLERVLRAYTIDGELVVPPDDAEAQEYLERVIAAFKRAQQTEQDRETTLVRDREELVRLVEERGAKVTTDGNMGEEWSVVWRTLNEMLQGSAEEAKP